VKVGMPRVWRDVMRIGGLLVLNGILLVMLDEANAVVIQATMIGLFLVGGSHLTRRVLFPDLDLQEFAKTAKATPLGAALVFMAICGFLSVVIFASMAVIT